LQNDSNINCLIDKVDSLQLSVNTLAQKLDMMQKEKHITGSWISEKEVIESEALGRPSRSSLLKLRKEGKLRSTKFSGKAIFYQLSDFKKLLDKNELEM